MEICKAQSNESPRVSVARTYSLSPVQPIVLYLVATPLMRFSRAGSVSQWGEVKKKNKDRSRSKAKEPAATLADSVNAPARGGRGRGNFEGGRGVRGRGSERGRGAGRGGRGGPTSSGNHGSAIEKSSDALVETLPSSNSQAQVVGSWDTAPTKAEESTDTSWEHPVSDKNTTQEALWGSVNASETTAAAPEAQKSSLIPDGTRSWASMFAKPTPVPAPSTAPQLPQVQPSQEVEDTAFQKATGTELPTEIGLPPPGPSFEQISVEESVPETPGIVSSEPALNITPSKDELTETNLEHVLDTSAPPPTATAASTIESTQDGRSLLSTPLNNSQQQPISRPPMGGFATSAYKATGNPGRSSSYQRRVMEQQEAVVMPGKHAVDVAAVKFGSLGFNGTADDVDVDEDREEAETRAQPPQHSPIAPRAALPPAPQQQSFPSQQSITESLPTPRQAPGLPPAAPQQLVTQQSPPAIAPQAMAPQSSQGSYPYNQFGRYGQAPAQQESPAPAQKSYDAFAQQPTQPTQPTAQSPYGGYSSQSQTQAQQQPQAQPQTGAFSSAPNDYSAYYTSDQQRNAYQNYYGSYGQQTQQNQTDAAVPQQRSGSGFGVSSAETPSQYPASQSQQPQPRYGQPGEAQTSGHSTPNPTIPGQQQHHQLQQSQQLPQQHQGQATGPGGYPYGHPYYASPYYAAYLNQVSDDSHLMARTLRDENEGINLTHHQMGYGNQGYAAPYGGKSGMYGQPHQGYGISPQSSYDQSSSPANVGGFGQHSMPPRDGALVAGGMGGYGRSGSAQPSENQQHSTNSGAFGGMPDVFGRSQSGYSGQSQPLLQQHGGQQGINEDTLKPYAEVKGTAGPNSALAQPGRPGSAVNMPAQPGQSGLPPALSHQNQQTFGGYPTHLNHQMHGQQGSQYGAALGGHNAHHQASGQNHQASGYGNYGAGQFGSYYGSSGRGGWGGNYGH